MDALSDSTTVKRTETSLATTIDGEAVVLERDSGIYFGLNEVATYVWESLSEPRSFGELRETVLSEYDVSWERCDRDLEEIISEFDDRGLVELEERSRE